MLILWGIVSLVYVFFSFRTMNNQLSGTAATQGLMVGIMIAAVLLWAGISFLIHKLAKRGFGIVKMFLVSYFTLGFLFYAAIPLYGTPDEPAHYERIYGITEGYIIADVSENGGGGSLLPVNITEGNYDSDTTLESNRLGFNISASSDKVFISYPNTAYYAPVTYLPQIIGAFLARLFTDRLYVIAYTAKLFNFIAVGLLFAAAIRLIPYGKEIFVIMGLFPITLQESVALAGDGFTMAIAALFTAYVVHAICDSGGLSTGEIVLGFVLIFILGFCKFIYAPLAALLIMVPADRFGGSRKKTLLGIGAVIMLAVECFGWLAITNRYLGCEFRAGVDMMAQRDVILSAPISFLGVFVSTIGENLSYLATGMVASHLGIYNIETPIWISRLGLIMLLLCTCITWERTTGKTSKRKRAGKRLLSVGQCLWMLFIVLLIALLIGVSEYLQWTPVGASRIEGIQGRYFLPTLPCFMLVLYELIHSLPFSFNADRELLYHTGAFISLIALVSVFSYYII